MSAGDESVDDRARRWFGWAGDDLVLARSAHADSDAVPRGACMWAHQCAEKALKAAVVAQDLDPPKTHNLLVLEQLMPRAIVEALGEVDLEKLTSWSIQGRYPGDLEDATSADAGEPIEAASAVLRVVQGHLGSQEE